jgi:hypothetical protein
LLLTALGCLVLRAAGVVLAGALRADHPVVAWASAVSLAILSGFVALAVVAPAGLLATVPLPTRLAGLLVGLLVHRVLRWGLLPSLAAGLAVVVLARWF